MRFGFVSLYFWTIFQNHRHFLKYVFLPLPSCFSDSPWWECKTFWSFFGSLVCRCFSPQLFFLFMVHFVYFLSPLFPAAVSNLLLILSTVFLLISCIVALISRSSILIFFCIYNTQQFTQVQSSSFLNIWDIVVTF